MQVEGINPAVLEWARNTAGLSVEDAAHRLGLSSGQKESASEKLEAMERGERAPTAAQLGKMAATYHRPLLSLYMSEPPRAADRGEDFRTTTAPVPSDEAARLDALVRDVRMRHAILRDVMSDEEDATRRIFVGSMPITTPVAQAAARVREGLGIVHDSDARRGVAKPADLFGELRRRVEAMGVFVILLGDLGNYRTAISPSVFRGFAVADDLAPLIVINDQDAKSAWSFTLIHELVHLFVGSTGVSGAPTTIQPHTPAARIERFCNDVAGEVLLPTRALVNIERVRTAKAVMELAETLSAAWKVSASMAAYRLWRIGKADDDAYGEAVRVFAERWRLHRQREKDKAKESDSGPSYYVVRRHRLGDALLQFVGRSLRADALTHTTAAKLFGVRPGAVEGLLAGVPGLGGARPSRERQARLMYLLDANTLIRANADYYPIRRIPQFWDWLIDRGRAGVVKIPNEIADEITAGRDAVSDWLKDRDARNALRLDEAADANLVRKVVELGYAPDLTDAEMALLGRDPFLMAYGLAASGRTVKKAGKS